MEIYFKPESFLPEHLFASGQYCAPGANHNMHHDINIIKHCDIFEIVTILQYSVHPADPPLGSARPQRDVRPAPVLNSLKSKLKRQF